MVGPRLACLADRRFDLLIIGGGINGAGIAREAACRGLSVALVEKLDYASGSTSRSTRLIHGGLRYLEHGELMLVLESLREREALLRHMPHMVRPLSFLIPVFDHSSRSVPFIRAGMLLYDLLSAGKGLPRHRFLDRGELRRLERQAGSLKWDGGLKGAFLYYDAQVNYPERLTVDTIAAARQAGAVALNHCEVLEFVIRDGRVTGTRVRDTVGGEETTVDALLTVNASGPWVNDFDALLGIRRKTPLLMPTRGSHLVVGPFEGAPGQAIYFEARSDRRPVFIIPWNGLYLIGTTDVVFSGKADDVQPSEEEVRYLLEETSAALPQARLTRGDILYTYAGIRPLPHTTGAAPAELTRGHLLYDHEKNDGVGGLCSVIGGKLTTYRHLARDAVDFAMKKLGRRRRRAPAEEPPAFTLWDWRDSQETLEKQAAPMAAQYGVAPGELLRLLATYGRAATAILEMWRENAAWRRPLCEHTRVTAAEALYAARREQALTAGDVLLRRTCAALEPCRGLDALPRVAELLDVSPEPARKEIERTLPRV